MPDPDRLFLTRAEAIDAIRIDLCQYPTQRSLLQDLARQVLNRSTAAAEEDAIWITTDTAGRMKRMSWAILQDRIITRLRTAPPGTRDPGADLRPGVQHRGQCRS